MLGLMEIMNSFWDWTRSSQDLIENRLTKNYQSACWAGFNCIWLDRRLSKFLIILRRNTDKIIQGKKNKWKIVLRFICPSIIITMPQLKQKHLMSHCLLVHPWMKNRETRPDTRPPVADGWAGAEMHVFKLFDSCSPTEQRTDQRTDGQSLL